MTSTNERDSHFFLAGWNGAWRNVNASEHFQNVSKTAPAAVAVRDALAGVSAPAAQAAPAAQSVANADGRFTKNPVTIDAIKWTGSNLREVIAFTDGPPDTRSIHAGMAWEAYVDLVARDGLKIYTLEGKMLANIGDWIIRGIKGEYYPCKPDIFEATYTSAPQAQAVERDAEQERWMEIGKAIERACIDQPDSTEIVISLERDAGTVTMFDPDGNEHDQFSHEDGFAGVVNAAIEAAVEAAKEQG